MKIKVGQSYNRKIPNSEFGQSRYGSTDFGSWIEMEIEGNKEKAKQVSRALGVFVRQEVKHAIEKHKQTLLKEAKDKDEPFETEYKEEDDGQLLNPR